jgi:hypothetical protein
MDRIVSNTTTVNNRGVIDWCLFGRFGEETNKDISASLIYTACNNRCTKLYTAADYMVKSAPSSYNFCDTAGNFTQDAESCLDCLYKTPGLTTLGNGTFYDHRYSFLRI